MKDILKYISLLILIVFSFYYTDKISTMIIYESDLMQEIIEHKKVENKAFTNAIITGKYITPGLNGLEINELDSYYQMKKDYLYSRNKLVFNEVEPDTSIEKNKRLIINRGNEIKKAVSIIFANNPQVEKYLENILLKVNKLINYSEFNNDSRFEQINNENDLKKLDILLDKYKINTNICIVNKNNEDKCRQAKKYLVEPTYYVDNVSIIGGEITSGDIIFISDELTLSNFKLLLKKVSYRDLDIIYLSELISEKRYAK
ncbi:MAG: hypothetical protein E7167_01025 [Firmicutes bacterium]|nr:hypothetical protein [Bacillota bacterium]